MSVTDDNQLNNIAIVGMACRVPGAKNIDEFWQNLRQGKESVTFFTDEQLEKAGVPPELFNDENYVKANVVLDDIEMFDASFFGFTPREAEVMDPQHRLFLESAWQVLEHAGYVQDKYHGSIGVYAGASQNFYLLNNLYANRRLVDSVGALALAVGSNADCLATRASYKMNLKGPAVVVQSACSTSLVAVHLACQSLLSGECDMAMAGGVSVVVPQNQGYLYQEDGIFSPDGHCRAFDANAKGTIGGRGVGIVLLKRFEDAVADGDCIHAVIRGSAVNNDGSLKAGYTAPSVDGQSAVIAEALAVAGVDAGSVTYVEAHGTGTTLGDPIEVAALTQAFRNDTQENGFCAIGSVKSNLGHLDTAAGVVGLIKSVLAMQHREIPPSLHYESPNPKIDFANSPFFVNNQLTAWSADGGPRRAGVSSFGIGGTNAHVVVEEAPVREKTADARAWKILPVSAKTRSALDVATESLAEHLTEHSDLEIADVAYTLQVGRGRFTHRRVVVCQDRDDAINTLSDPDSKRILSGVAKQGKKSVAFMFPGQGAQYVNMAEGLYQSEPVFREWLDRCATFLQPHLGLNLLDILYPDSEQTDSATARLNETQIAQPALFAVEYALAQLWISWGVQPQAMIGHSIGEYVAACLADVFSLEDGLALIAARARLMQTMPTGSMMAVPLAAEQVLDLVKNGPLSLATVNAPNLCVVSGPTNDVDEFEKQLKEKAIESRHLHTSHAFHSQMMNDVLEPFAEQASKISYSDPTIPYLSNVTGTWITPSEAKDPQYWARHLRNTVHFAKGAMELAKESNRILLEVGPGKTLSSLMRQQSQDAAQRTSVSSIRHPKESAPDVAFLYESFGRLWLAGYEVDWQAFHAAQRRQRVPLPTYPFERQRFWIEPQPSDIAATDQRTLQKKSHIAEWFYLPSWKRVELSSDFSIEGLEKEYRWLVFTDASGWGSRLVEQLVRAGQTVVTVSQGKQFSQLDDHSFAVDSTSPTDYENLVSQLQSTGDLPDKIVHLWCVGSSAENSLNDSLLEQSTNDGFYSLIFLTTALGGLANSDAIDLSIVTNNLYEVIDDELLHPQAGTVIGPLKVIPLEYPNITCRNIDLTSHRESGSPDLQSIEQLVSEVVSPMQHDVIAYRRGHRWVQTAEQVQLHKSATGKSRLRDHGVYLITGGTGGIGLALAEFLANRCKARLILVSRSGLPEKSEWDSWLATHDHTDDNSRKIRKVQNLESLGAEVLVCAADSADRRQMQKVVSQGLKRFGEINGVIHSGGVAGGGMIQLKKKEVADAVLAPKVKGTAVLGDLFEEHNLDFFVICSSGASILGGYGQVDYCGANAFQDSFAHWNNSHRGTFTVAINWDTWSDVGMAVETDVPDELKKQREMALKLGIQSNEGAIAFERILHSNFPQVIVSTRDWQPRIEEMKRGLETTADLDGDDEVEAFETAHARPGLSSDYQPPVTSIEKELAEIWQKMFGIDQVGIHDDFFELGGHSLLATQLLNKIGKSYDRAGLSLRVLFDSPTIADLAKLIEKVYGDEADNGQKSIRDILVDATESNRIQLIEDYLLTKISGLLQLNGDQITAESALSNFDFEPIMPDLIHLCRREFNFRLYPHEIGKQPTINKFAEFIQNEFSRINNTDRTSFSNTSFLTNQLDSDLDDRAPPESISSTKNPSAIFLLSAPRSGSTLLRLMLAGHSVLFCPPELGLLSFDSFGKMRTQQSEHPITSAVQSPLVKLFAELTDAGFERGKKLLDSLAEQDVSTAEIYRQIQSRVQPRTLVDKTPSYALSYETLVRAEELFEDPKYILLVRHPYSMIDSSVRYRLQVYFDEFDVDPYVFADEVWAICNRNILALRRRVGEDRCRLIRYEDLVCESNREMNKLCEFLNVPFEDALLRPYDDGRMIEGPGDLDILRHDHIDKSLADAWQSIELPVPLSEQSRQLAAELKYELPHDAEATETAKTSPEQMLANLDELSDEEVEQLFDKMSSKISTDK